MDIRLLQNVVAELSARISGAKIAKIHQPSAELFTLRLWTGQQTLKLLISAAPGDSRIHLTEQSLPNPFTPPRFCQLLRARLSRISMIRQLNDDRIVELSCDGPKGVCRLLVELTGKSSNLVLVDEAGRIIDALKRTQAKCDRPMIAGADYSCPIKVEPPPPPADESTTVNFSDNKSASLSVEKLYSAPAPAVKTADLRSRLALLIIKEQKKLARRLKNIEQELKRQQNFEHYRQSGDLLLANLHLLKKGMSAAVVVNYYLQPSVEVAIPLNPLLSPQQNADKYFQKYKKARRGVEHSARRKAETDSDLEWLAQLDYQLKSTDESADVAIVADELRKAGILKEKISKLPRLNKVKKATFRTTVSPNGYKVLWGTNSRQNDALSTKELKNGDLWFHAHRCPGSHVVLKADAGKGAFADDDIEFTASIAAARSRTKDDYKVEIMVVAAKDVKKPPGAKPGMVTVKQYKTLMVKPFMGTPDVF